MGWGRGRTRGVRPSVRWASPPGAGISPLFFLLLFFQHLSLFKSQRQSPPAGRWHFAFGRRLGKAEREEHRGWVQHRPTGTPGLPAPLARFPAARTP